MIAFQQPTVYSLRLMTKRVLTALTSKGTHLLAMRSLTVDDTNLIRNGAAIMDGLDSYTVPANGDEHPLSVYGIQSKENILTSKNTTHRPVLMLHGRTWSSVPVYHLLGGESKKDGHESRSLMEALYESGLQPYAMDFRGFGGTPNDSTGYVEPNRCVKDAKSVLKWIADRHGVDQDVSSGSSKKSEMPVLFGWSQGALVAQLLAQNNSDFISKLILYGSIYDPTVRYNRDPLYQINTPNTTTVNNTFNAAIEDFTVEGSIPPEPARLFAEAALVSDPYKAIWKRLYQFNNLDPSRVHIPTLVVAGDQDPYTTLQVQQELFTNLGRGCDRTWSIISEADHAVHLLEGRDRFVKIVTSFVNN